MESGFAYFDCVIVGAGLAGATAARKLAEKGYRVVLIEKRRHIAGLCYDDTDAKTGITVQKYGPHIFHTKNEKVWNFVSSFAAFSHYQHRVLSYVDGQMYKFPINRDTLNSVFGMTLQENEVEPFLAKQVADSIYNKDIKSFRDKIVSQIGERLYNLFFKNYTIKQWKTDPDYLSSDLAGRIPIRSNCDDRYFSDPFQGIPTEGYTNMIQNMLDHPNITVMLGADWFCIKDQFVNRKLLVYTAPLDEYFNFKQGKLAYRSLDIVFKTLDIDSFQASAVVNYPNDYAFTRITEFKKLTEQHSSKTILCYEYPSSKGEPFYTIPTAENETIRKKYFKDVQDEEKTGKVLFIGRLAEYCYYNMDNVIEVTLNKIDQWINSQE